MQDANVWQKRKRISRLTARRGALACQRPSRSKVALCGRAGERTLFTPVGGAQTSDNSGVVIARATFLTQLRPEET
jgi:hypothetical protein